MRAFFPGHAGKVWYVEGHGIPVITVMTSLTVAVVTVFVTVAAIVCTGGSLIRDKKIKPLHRFT